MREKLNRALESYASLFSAAGKFFSSFKKFGGLTDGCNRISSFLRGLIR